MSYPKVVINRDIMRENMRHIIDTCHASDINVVGVIKGVNGMPEIMSVMMEAGITTIASSRIPQLKKAKELSSEISTYDLRIPMLSEVEDVVRYADISLNSELTVLQALNEAAVGQHKIHKVIIMLELGDLREGIYTEDELIHTALVVENELDNLFLYGVGTNLGCYGSIMPTTEKMEALLGKAASVEKAIGRKLDVISGGATTSYPLVGKGQMPTGINELRIGDGLYVNDLDECFHFETLTDEALVLQAEIIELKDKPSYPIGEIAVNAFGDKPYYEDRGIRTRALVAIGRQDIGDCGHLRPIDPNIQVIGGSSDHTILDVTDCEKEYEVGDIIEFHLMYENLLMVSQSEYVEKEFV